jgi:hypothetical protein
MGETQPSQIGRRTAASHPSEPARCRQNLIHVRLAVPATPVYGFRTLVIKPTQETATVRAAPFVMYVTSDMTIERRCLSPEKGG